MKFVLIFPETSLSHNAVPDTAIATTARSETVQSKFTVDYDRLIENIKDLNVLAGEGVSKIHHTNDGARLRVNFSSFESIWPVYMIPTQVVLKIDIVSMHIKDAHSRILLYCLYSS